ncbi:MAG: RsmB/NOP family class I SAM-dependent RNA methyltransferase [Bacteroidota bacterium]
MNYTSLVGHIIELCELIDKNSSPADNVITNFHRGRKYLGSHDRRYIVAVVFGILRNRRLLEALLEQYLLENPSNEILNTPVQRYIPLLAAYLIVIDHETEENLNTIIGGRWNMVFPAVDFTHYIRWTTAHADLAFLPNDVVTRLGVQYSYLDWMVERFKGEYGDDLENLLTALNSPANTTLRVNTLKCSHDECRERLRREGIETDSTPYSPVGLITKKRFNKSASKAFADGWFEIQDEGSQLVSFLCGVQPGQVVIDGCAGTGGKALHLAGLMANEGEIIAIDIYDKRLFELQARAARAGIQIIQVLLKETIIPENFFNSADLVLIDAPCSGSGTLRRNPGLKWTLTESLVSHYAQMQSEILDFNARFVKKGGRLLYATCSLFREENEDVIQKFLQSHSDFSMMPLFDTAQTFGISANVPYLKLLPHKINTDGFFVAEMVRL